MAIPVKLEVFEGPLDLLLHLIDKNKIDIYDIPIAEITEQYLDYIRKMLLPREVNEEGEEEDPRAELVERLLEYKMYKYMAYELKDRQMDAGQVLYRAKNLPKEVASYRPPLNYEELLGDLTLNKLQDIFQSMLKRQEDKIDPVRSNFGKIEKDEIDMDAKMVYIEDYVRSHRTFSFRSLLEKQHSKVEIIVTFMVILEMMKLGRIGIVQEHLFDDIQITVKDVA